MKRSIGPAMLVIALGAGALTGFATLAEAQTASANPPHYANAPHYTVTNLGTLGVRWATDTAVSQITDG
jgi:hypothetical protein